MKFEWDTNKEQINLLKNGLTFTQAIPLFDDDLLSIPDLRFDYGESRYIGYGKIDNRLMVVVYTERIPDIIRIISFRKANDREQKIYK